MNSRFAISIIVVIMALQSYGLRYASAQNGPLTYPMIITGLRSDLRKGMAREMVIQRLISDVGSRKVDKPLTQDREADLRQAGATEELIDAIKKNSPPLKVEAKPVVPDLGGRDQEAWDLVKNSKDSADFKFFLQEFPTGANAEKAKVRIEEIMWANAKVATDKAPVQAYLTEFPNGSNAAAARIKLRQLEAAGGGASISTSTNKPAPTDNGGQTTSRPSSPPVNSPAPGSLRKNANGLEFVYVPAGDFLMGSSDAEIDEALAECNKFSTGCERAWYSAESPKRKVSFRTGFWITRYEITQAQWKSIMGNNPSKFKDCGELCPIENVSFDDAQEFIRRLNLGNDGFEYSLPSEAQWEYAARAGTATPFAYGNSLSSLQANFNGNYPYSSTKNKFIQKTVPVGSYQPNAWGIYDMHGNVWEWTLDTYSSYVGAPTDGSPNIVAADSNLRVLRGGSWYYFGGNARSAGRSAQANNAKDNGVGVRVVARQK